MVYKWANGWGAAVPARVAGEVCTALEEEGRLTAAELVKASAPEEAPLHKCFEWDDAKAGVKWREQQARIIINHLVIVRPEQEPVRCFFSLERTQPQYTALDAILKSPEKTDSLLKCAYAELESFRRKYARLEKLAAVITEINKILKGENDGEDSEAVI